MEKKYYLNDPQREKQLKREAKQRLTNEFVELIMIDHDSSISWNSTTTDLIEMIHVVYQTGRVCNTEGKVCTFKEMISRTCTVLNHKQPQHARQMAYNGENRRGVRNNPFFERYCRQAINTSGNRSLLEQYITRN